MVTEVRYRYRFILILTLEVGIKEDFIIVQMAQPSLGLGALLLTMPGNSVEKLLLVSNHGNARLPDPGDYSARSSYTKDKAESSPLGRSFMLSFK